MNKIVKLSSIKNGEWFYNEELKMVCLVYSKENKTMWYLSSDGDCHFHDFQNSYLDLDVEHIEDSVNWTDIYKKYPYFDEDIRNTMLLLRSKEQEYEAKESELKNIEDSMDEIKTDCSNIRSYLSEKMGGYKKIDDIKNGLNSMVEQLDGMRFENYCPEFE